MTDAQGGDGKQAVAKATTIMTTTKGTRIFLTHTGRDLPSGYGQWQGRQERHRRLGEKEEKVPSSCCTWAAVTVGGLRSKSRRRNTWWRSRLRARYSTPQQYHEYGTELSKLIELIVQYLQMNRATINTDSRPNSVPYLFCVSLFCTHSILI